MPKRLFQFVPANRSGNYRVQLVNCTTGAVLTVGNYLFQVELTGQPTNSVVSGSFDNIPAGTIIPAGNRLKVIDLANTSAYLLGPCMTSPITVCQNTVPCSVSALTLTLGNGCSDGKKTISYSFTSSIAGSYAVEVYRNSSGVLVSSETVVVSAPGIKTGSIAVPVIGLFPGTSLLVRVVNLADTTCLTSNVGNLLLTTDAFTTVGPLYRGGTAGTAICAAIQVAACAGTYRVVAVDCTTGAILSQQPTDWPIQFTTLAGAQEYLKGKGYTLLQAPKVICTFGNIRKIALNYFTTYFLPIDSYFSGLPVNFSVVTQTGNPVNPLQVSLLLSQVTENDAQGNPVIVRYLQISINTSTPGTLNWRLVAGNTAGSASIDFSVITISSLSFQLANALMKTIHPGILNILQTNQNITQVVLTRQGDCIGGTSTGTLSPQTDLSLQPPYTKSLTLPALPRGLYSVRISNGTDADNVTLSIPLSDEQTLVNTIVETTPQPIITHRFRDFEHFEFVPIPTTGGGTGGSTGGGSTGGGSTGGGSTGGGSTARIAHIEANDCERITGYIFGGAARIERDGNVVALIDASFPREQGLIDYLATQGIIVNTNLLGFGYFKPAGTGSGNWRVFVGSSNVEASINVSASVDCSGTSGNSNPAPQTGTAIGAWQINSVGTSTKTLPDGAFTDNNGDTATYTALWYDPAFGAYVSLPYWVSINTSTGQLTAIVDNAVVQKDYLFRIVRTDSAQQSAAQEFVTTVSLPPVDSNPGCDNYSMLTTTQLNALPIVMIYEYYDGSVSMGGGLSYTVRPFSTREEAIQLIPTNVLPNTKAAFDFNRATTAACNVGDYLYNDNRLIHILNQTNAFWPVEAGWWGTSYTAPEGGTAGSYILFQTNNCGQIISRETIIIPGN